MSDIEGKVTDHEGRISAVETGLREVKSLLTEIKVQVSNHIPTQMEKISDTVQCLVKKETKRAAIHEFLNGALKTTAVLAGLTYTAFKILEVFRQWYP